MKSLQICLLSALLVICASNPIPQEPAVTPVAPQATPAVKVADTVPAVAVTEVPAQKSLDNEKIPEPQALPSKKEDIAPVKAEEKKREVAVTPAVPIVPAVPASEQPTAKSPELPVPQPQKDVQQPESVTGKSLPEPAKVAVPEASTPKPAEQQPAESVKSIAVVEQPTQTPAEPAPTPAAAVAPEAKQVDDKQAVESTVVPVVPSGIASEKKIEAGS